MVADFTYESYFAEVFNDRTKILRPARRLLKNVDFDTLIGTGLSGSLIVPILADGLKRHWAVVRKDNDGSHSSREIEGRIGERWIFVDDFISSGATRRRVIDAVTNTMKYYGYKTEYVGAYLYNEAIPGEYFSSRRRAVFFPA
jgi:orotate phosphoribosyltransferase